MLSGFFRPPPHTGRVSCGLLILRVIVGLAFIQYGMLKLGAPTAWAGTSLPAFVQVFALVAELGGGVLLVLGALTPLAALLIAIDMVGAIVTFVIPHGGAIWISPMPKLTLEKNVFYTAGALAILFAGPGLFSIDALLARNAREEILAPTRR